VWLLEGGVRLVLVAPLTAAASAHTCPTHANLLTLTPAAAVLLLGAASHPHPPHHTLLALFITTSMLPPSRYFGNVCELDLIFNFHKAYYILDELLIAGEGAGGWVGGRVGEGGLGVALTWRHNNWAMHPMSCQLLQCAASGIGGAGI
jgi:hypothetical protein